MRGLHPGNEWRYVEECDKRGHVTRASAKAQARAMRKAGEHVRPYKCEVCGFFHVGHLPRAVMKGRVSDVEYYGR